MWYANDQRGEMQRGEINDLYIYIWMSWSDVVSLVNFVFFGVLKRGVLNFVCINMILGDYCPNDAWIDETLKFIFSIY